MTNPQFSLAYSVCSVTELRDFVRERVGRDASSNKTHDYYVRKFERLDRHARFRFFDLPPELRAYIYREVLTWTDSDSDSDSRSVCYPQILSTCKLAYREARDMLYAENVESIQLALGNPAPCVVRVGGGHTSKRDLVTTMSLEGVGWRPHLRKCAHLRIEIDVDPSEGARGVTNSTVARRINNLLYSLANNLAGHKHLETVELRQQGDHGYINGSLYPHMLYPLRKLAADNRVLSPTGVPSPLAAEVTKKSINSAAKCNLIERCWQLEDRVKAALHLPRGFGLDKLTTGRFAGCAGRLQDMAMGMKFVGRKWEEEMLEVMGRYEEGLKG